MANAAAKKAQKLAAAEGIKLIARNKRVGHDYEILQKMEAGIVLAGSEVKSLREGNVQFADAHARLDDRGECWLYNLYIGEYKQAGIFNHLATARRKILLNKGELKNSMAPCRPRACPWCRRVCTSKRAGRRLNSAWYAAVSTRISASICRIRRGIGISKERWPVASAPRSLSGLFSTAI